MKKQPTVVIGVAPPEQVDQVIDAYGQVAVVISKVEVDACATGRVVAALMALTDTRKRVDRFEDALLFSFEGYADDTREVWEIPEVVRYFAAVNASWPHWLHYLAKMPAMFGLMLTLLMQRAALGHEVAGRLPRVDEPGALQALLLDLFEPMNTLYAAHGLGMARNRAMTDRVVAAAVACTAPPP
jgi:hypothetical protein